MIYLGRWRWITDDIGPHWEAPPGTVSVIDLRTFDACSKRGVVEGWGLFDIPGALQVAPGLQLLGMSMDDIPNAIASAAAALALGITIAPTETISDIIFRALTTGRDLLGSRTCPGLLPDASGKLRLRIGSHLREEAFSVGDAKHWPGIRAEIRKQYRAARQESFDGLTPANHYLKVLDFWREQYNADWREFVPDDLPQEQPVAHATTITESFNTANSGTLGPDLTWSEIEVGAATFAIVSNQAEQASPDAWGSARADSDLSSADHYSQIDCIATGGATTLRPPSRASGR